MTEPKITFAEAPKAEPQTVQASARVTGPTTLAQLYGLPIALSPGVGDILAAIHMAFEMFKALMGVPESAGQQGEQVILPADEGGPYPDTFDDIIDMGAIRAMRPEARAEFLRAHGLTFAMPEPTEADETAAQLRKMMNDEGIPTEPGPGGAWAPGAFEGQEEDVED